MSENRTADVLTFPNPRGRIEISPCDERGGSWLVEHIKGRKARALGSRFAFDDALQLARDAAERIGATLVEGVCL